MPRLKPWRCISCRETRGHCAWGWNNPSTQLGPLSPPFLVERKASHCTTLWHRAGTGIGLRGTRLHSCHSSLILPRHLRTTHSSPEGPLPALPALLFIPRLLPCSPHNIGQLALVTLNYPSKYRLCWQPFLPSFQLFLRNRQAGPERPCCRELPADGWPASQSPLPQSHISPGFSL